MSWLSLPSWRELLLRDPDTLGVSLLSARDILFLLTALENHRYETRYYETEGYVQDDNDLFLDTLIVRLKMVDFCTQVAECLTDTESPANEALNDAIGDYLEQNTDTPVLNQEIPPSATIHAQNPVFWDGSGSCNESQLFGAIRAVLTRMNTAIMDLFEFIEGKTNTAELGAFLASKAPWMGQYVSAVPEWLDWLLETFAENYASAYTQDLQDEMACELFCDIKTDCVLDFNDFADYFASKIGLGYTGDMLTLLDTVFSSAWAGTQMVYGMHYLVFLCLSFYQNFFGFDLSALTRVINIAIGYEDNDYTVLCTDCPSDCVPLGTSRSWSNSSSDANSPTWVYPATKSDSNSSPHSGYMNAGARTGVYQEFSLGASRCITHIYIRVYRAVAETNYKYRVRVGGDVYFSEPTTGSGHNTLDISFATPVYASMVEIMAVSLEDIAKDGGYTHWVEVDY